MITIQSALTVLIELAVVVGICYALLWVIDSFFPAPIQVFSKIFVGLVAFVILIYILLGLAGVHA